VGNGIISKRSMLDLALVPFAFVAGYVMKAAARLDHRTPKSQAMLDRLGVNVIRRHYYTPLVNAADLHRPLEEERPLPGLDLNVAGQLALVAEFDFADELRAFPEEPTGPGYFYGNGAYAWGDAELLYDMIRHFRPSQIVEIGSGYSTLMACAAIDANQRADRTYACKQVCIEPYQMPWLETLNVEVVRERVELVDRSLFSTLRSGDILFIDSSHVIRPQGDVVTEFLEILPTLAPGVVVHVHDVFTPRDYPRQWVVEERRLWNEQYLLEAFLSFNSDFEVIAALNWLSHHHRDRLVKAVPMLMERPGHEPGAFWFRRK
jgi:hypothetical protein